MNSKITPTVLFLASALFAVFFAEGTLQAYYQFRAWQSPAPVAKRDTRAAYDTVGQDYETYAIWPTMQYNSFLGYIPLANHSGRGYRTNNRNFRHDRDLDERKVEGELRIFVTGGSTSWGTGVRQDQHFAVVAERLLNAERSDGKVSVYPAAAGSWTTTNERILIQNVIAQLSADTVVLFTGFNDLYFGYIGENPHYHNDYLGFAPVLERHLPAVRDLQSTKVYYPQPRDYALKLKFLFDRVQFRWRYRNAPQLEEAITQVARSPQKVVEGTLQNVHSIVDLAKRTGFKVVVMLQPSLFTTKKALTPPEDRFLAPAAHVGYKDYLQRGYQILRSELPADAKREGYLYYDADEAVRTADTLFVDECHLGDRGNARLGHYLAQAIRDSLSARRIASQTDNSGSAEF